MPGGTMGKPAGDTGRDRFRSSRGCTLPTKIRDLVAELQRAGFVDRGGKGSHRNFVHERCSRPVTISGRLGDDAKQYQIRAVRMAIQEMMNEG